MMCLVGRPSAESRTYYALVLECAKGQNQLSEECKNMASDCLERESLLEEAIVEAFSEPHSAEMEEVFTMNDSDFHALLKNNPLCENVKPKGLDDTYMALILNCAFENGQYSNKCRKVAEGCLAEEEFEKAIEIDKTSQTQEESFRKIYQSPFNLLEQDIKMQDIIKNCTTEHEVQRQWFWNFQADNACNGGGNLPYSDDEDIYK